MDVCAAHIIRFIAGFLLTCVHSHSLTILLSLTNLLQQNTNTCTCTICSHLFSNG